MPDFGAWLNWQPTGDVEAWLTDFDRADNIMALCSQRGASVVFVREGVAQTAQTLLVVPGSMLSSPGNIASEVGRSASENVLIVGPDTAIILKRDRFSYRATPTGRLNFEVTFVEKLHNGMIQAAAKLVE